MDDYYFDHQWEISGDFNWKVYADNYNEVAHHAYTAKKLVTNDVFSAIIVQQHILH